MDRCRICLSDSNLVDVFNKNIYDSKQLRQFILLTSGVEIKSTDVVSKMVCHRCCIIAVKTYKYRHNAIENDKMLKKKYGQEYVPPLPVLIIEDINKSSRQPGEGTSFTDIEIKTEKLSDNEEEIADSPLLSSIAKLKNENEYIQNEQICENNHTSVNTVLRASKAIIVPKGVLQDNISPVIMLNRDEVKEYLDKLGKDINEQMGSCLYQIEKMEKSEQHAKRLSQHRLSNKKFTQMNKTVNKINFSDAAIIHSLIETQAGQKRQNQEQGNSFLAKRHKPVDPGGQFSQVINHSTSESFHRPPTPDPLLSTTSKDDIFECQFCQQLFDKQRQLQDHLKVHLKCKVCKTKFKNMEQWMQHFNSSCHVSTPNNLTSTESGITNSDSNSSKSTISVKNTEKKKILPVTEILIPVTKETNLIDENCLELSDVEETTLPDFDQILQTTNISIENKNDNSDVVCVKDDINLKNLLESAEPITSNDIEIIDVDELDDVPLSEDNKTQDVLQNNMLNDPLETSTVSPGNNSTTFESVSVIHPEIELKLSDTNVVNVESVKYNNLKSYIISLFKKHLKNSKCDEEIQTGCVPDVSSIQHAGTYVNLLNMAPELNYWKIPVTISKHSKINVQFGPNEISVVNTSKRQNSINWSNIPPTDLVTKNSNDRKAKVTTSYVKTVLSGNGTIVGSIVTKKMPILKPAITKTSGGHVISQKMPVLKPTNTIMSVGNVVSQKMPVLKPTNTITSVASQSLTAVPVLAQALVRNRNDQLIAVPTNSIFRTVPHTIALTSNSQPKIIMNNNIFGVGQHYILNTNDSQHVTPVQPSIMKNIIITPTNATPTETIDLTEPETKTPESTSKYPMLRVKKNLC